ncbi:hypothetical protein pb186bvf_018049 [Paramecium bursaria]
MASLTVTTSQACLWQYRRYKESLIKWERIELQSKRDFIPPFTTIQELLQLDPKQNQYLTYQTQGQLLDKFYYVWRYNDGREGFQLCGILKDKESHIVINLGWIPVELRDSKHNLANKEYQFKILIKRPEFSDVLKRQEFKGFIDLQQIVKENNLNQESLNVVVDRLGDEGLFEDKLYPYPNQLQRPYLTPETHSAYSTFWGSCTILGLFSIRKLLKM